MLLIINTNMTSTDSQLMNWNHQHRTKRFYCSHQDKPNQTPLSSIPRQSVILWRIMAVHQSTAVKDPPRPRHQKHQTQTHVVINWYHHPHGQEAEVYSTSCNSCWELSFKFRFLSSGEIVSKQNLLLVTDRNFGTHNQNQNISLI